VSKDSLVKGTLILTVAALVARFLGVFQRIPLIYLIDDKGMGSYGVAFNLYQNLLVIATAGIPSALSKLIAETTALGRQREADRIYRAAIWFALGAGAVMAVLLMALAPWYAADVSGDPKAVLATQAIAPALLVFPLIAVMRGYFQGRQRMMPNGISQIVEQVFRLVAAVGLAYALLSVGEVQAIAGASFGGVIGGLAALAVMLYYTWKLRRDDRREAGARGAASTAAPGALAVAPGETAASMASAESAVSEPFSYKRIYGRLLRLSVPIVIYSMTVTLIYNIDTSSIHSLLEGFFGYEQRRELSGIMSGRAQSLAGIPIILAIALSQSIVPIISAAHSRGDREQVQAQTSRVLQLSILSGLPMVLLIAIAARPIDGFIFGYETSQFGYEHGPHMIALLTVGAMFQIVMQTSGAVLMGMGRMKPLMASVGIGIAVKLLGNVALTPWLGVYGMIVATGLCFVVMTTFNFLVLRQNGKFHVLGRRWLGLAFGVAVIVATGVLLEQWTHRHMHLFASARWNEGVNAVLVGGWTVALYPAMLMLFRVFTKEDIAKLPRPLQKLVGKGQRLLGRAGA
jgi:stage V sporulation protein B